MPLELMHKAPYIREPSIKFTTGSFCDGTWEMTEEERCAHRLSASSDDRAPEQKSQDESVDVLKGGSNAC